MIGYQDLIKNVKVALINKDKAETTLTNMGSEVAEFFGSEKAIDEVKAQFCADAILPILKKHHAEALAKDLPKLNSKAYNELVSKDASYSEKWEIANQAKKDARSTIATYYKRVKSYAFPAEKKDKVVRSFADKIKALIEEAGKMSEANFDLPSCVGYLNQALFVATK